MKAKKKRYTLRCKIRNMIFLRLLKVKASLLGCFLGI